MDSARYSGVQAWQIVSLATRSWASHAAQCSAKSLSGDPSYPTTTPSVIPSMATTSTLDATSSGCYYESPSVSAARAGRKVPTGAADCPLNMSLSQCEPEGLDEQQSGEGEAACGAGGPSMAAGDQVTVLSIFLATPRRWRGLLATGHRSA